jgi:hypothetical protein
VLAGAATGMPESHGLQLGTFVGAGALDRGEAEHGLPDAAHSCRLVAVDGEGAVRANIRRGLDAGTTATRPAGAG